MAQAVRFIALNEATYNGLPSGEINENAIYFATDSKKIYKGASEQTQVAFHKASVQAYIPGKFYYQDQEVFFCNDLGELVSLTSVPYDESVSDKGGDHSSAASTQAVYEIVEELKLAIEDSFNLVQADIDSIKEYNNSVVTPAIMNSKEFLEVTLPELSYTLSETVGKQESMEVELENLATEVTTVDAKFDNFYDKESVNQMISATSWTSMVAEKAELDSDYDLAYNGGGSVEDLVEKYGSKFIWVPTEEADESGLTADTTSTWYDIYVLMISGDGTLAVFEKIDSGKVDLTDYLTKEAFEAALTQIDEAQLDLDKAIDALADKVYTKEEVGTLVEDAVAANTLVWEIL